MPDCPSCSSPFESGSPLCTNCGYDLGDMLIVAMPGSALPEPEGVEISTYVDTTSPDPVHAETSPALARVDPGLPPRAPIAPEPRTPPVGTAVGVSCSLCGAAEPPCWLCKDHPPRPVLILEKEGPELVAYEGVRVRRILQVSDHLAIGRRDPLQGHYPEIDLASFFEAGAHGISRRHGELVYRADEKQAYFRCLTDSRLTHYVQGGDQAPRVLERNDEVALREGDRIVIGNEVGFRVHLPGP